MIQNEIKISLSDLNHVDHDEKPVRMRAHGPGPVGSAVKIKNFLLIILLYHLLMLIMTIESYMYQLKLKSSIDKPICSYPASLCSVVPFTICT